MSIQFPPEVPEKLQSYVEIETVNESTVKVKDKKTGRVLKTVTLTEVEEVMSKCASPKAQG